MALFQAQSEGLALIFTQLHCCPKKGRQKTRAMWWFQMNDEQRDLGLCSRLGSTSPVQGTVLTLLTNISVAAPLEQQRCGALSVNSALASRRRKYPCPFQDTRIF